MNETDVHMKEKFKQNKRIPFVPFSNSNTSIFKILSRNAIYLKNYFVYLYYNN